MREPFVLDKKTILDRLGGDEEIYTMMVDMFLQDVDHYCHQIAQAYAGGEAPVVQREAHTIKGLLASFGDDHGTRLAYAIETSGKLGQLNGLDGQVDALQERVRLVAEVLRQS